MKRLMLLVLMLGCNYYGPDNPPPPDAEPIYRVQYIQATDPQGVAQADCPPGTIATSASCDCVWCDPPAGAYLFGCSVAGNSALAGCGFGCARVFATCISSSVGGTLKQGVAEPSPEAVALAAKWRRISGGH